jgi:hypothetical protein
MRKAIPKYSIRMSETTGSNYPAIAARLVKSWLILRALTWTQLGAVVGLIGAAGAETLESRL